MEKILNSVPIINTLSLRSAPSHTLLPHTTSSLIRMSVTRSPKHQPLNCKPRTSKPKDYARRIVVCLYHVYDGDMMWAQQYKLALRKWANQCKLALRSHRWIPAIIHGHSGKSEQVLIDREKWCLCLSRQAPWPRHTLPRHVCV